MTRPPLSVLDLSSLGTGQTSAQALAGTTELARRADELGYHRFWVAEHHAMPMVASTSPPVLVAHLAASTRRIRVGSGGVMLPNHPALVVAEQFAMLEALHPGRIDLGIGRAPGTDPGTAAALRRTPEGLGAEDFPQQLLEVLSLLGDPRDHPARRGAPAGPGAPGSLGSTSPGLTATPAPVSAPSTWLLGSSGYSAQLAGLLGLPFCFAHHFGSPGVEQALALYRDGFSPSSGLPSPHAMVSAGVLLAPTQEEADRLARPGLLLRRDLRTGRPLTPLLSPEEAAAVRLPEPEERALAAMPTGGAAGTPQDVVEHLEALVSRTGADELLVTTSAHDVATRVRTLELLAQAWPLPAPLACPV